MSAKGDSHLFRRDVAIACLAAVVAPGISTACGSGWAGIAVSSGAAWWLLRAQRSGPRTRLVAALLAWAALSSLAVIVFTVARPAAAADLVPNGPAYAREMFDWIATGHGTESEPSRFVPLHLAHLAAFVVLSVATGGWGGLLLGSWLLGYMSFYVGRVAASASHPLVAGALAWAPWAVLRVVAFIVLGVSLGRVLLDRLPPRRFAAEERRPLLVAAVLWLADLLLKALLAPHWPALLRAA